MKPFGQKKEKENASASPRQQAQFTEMLLMRLDGFIEENDKVVGVVGTIYPSRKSVEVRMTVLREDLGDHDVGAVMLLAKQSVASSKQR